MMNSATGVEDAVHGVEVEDAIAAGRRRK